MILKFHQTSDGKPTLLPIHAIKFIVAHDDGGTIIYTNLTIANSAKLRNFRTKESIEQLYMKMERSIYMSDGIFSNL